MNDKLKRFIEEHREEFDDREPTTELPDRILAARDQQGQSVVRRLPWTSMVAATLAAFLLLAIAIRYLIGKENHPPERLTGGEPMTKAEPKIRTDSALLQIDSARALQLEAISREAMARQSELESLRKDDPELYQRFLNDLAHLDSNYRSLREMLDRMPNQRQVLQAMEENLRTRLWMLERQGQLTREARESKKSKS